MEYFKCSAECQSDVVFQCTDDGEYICSMHLRKSHLRHKFKAIPKEEVALRRSLIEQFSSDLRSTSEESLTGTVRDAITAAAAKAAEDFKAGVEVWVEVHREQLKNLQQSLQQQAWPSAVKRVAERLTKDYSAPLVTYRLELRPLLVQLFSPRIEERKEESLLTRFRDLLKNPAAFYQHNRDSLMPEVARLWDSKTATQISVKNAASENDLLAILLFLAQCQSLRQVIIPRSRLTGRNCDCLSEALRLTKSDIRTVDISGNEIGDAGLAEVCSALRDKKSLGILAIRQTAVTDESIPLLKSFRGVKLDATGNAFSLNGKTELLAANSEHKV